METKVITREVVKTVEETKTTLESGDVVYVGDLAIVIDDESLFIVNKNSNIVHHKFINSVNELTSDFDMNTNERVINWSADIIDRIEKSNENTGGILERFSVKELKEIRSEI